MSEVHSEFGDVRIISDDPTFLYEHVLWSRIVFASDIAEQYPELAMPYDERALVPDPGTFRKLTDGEADHYLVEGEGATSAKNHVRIYKGLAATAFLETAPLHEWQQTMFGKTTSAPGQLTTTPTAPGSSKREGMHLDSTDSFVHRLGVNFGPADRRLIVATHSARELFGGNEATSGSASEYFARHPEILGAIGCLHISLKQNEIYEAWTGNVIHDGSTFHETKKEGANAPSVVAFVPLEAELSS